MARLPALPFVRAGVTQGLSANAAYRHYRTLATEQTLTTVRRQDFLRLYSQTLALHAQAPDAIQAPKDTIHGGLTPEPRDTVRARGFGYHVSQYWRTSGGEDFGATNYIVSRREPITPAEAEAQVLSWIENQSEQYNRVTLGVSFIGVEAFNPAPR